MIKSIDRDYERYPRFPELTEKQLKMRLAHVFNTMQALRSLQATQNKKVSLAPVRFLGGDGGKS